MSAVANEARMQALVTRPRAAAQGLAAALAARGVTALLTPVIEIDYRGGAALDLTGVQAVLCTSANGVRALARASGERRLPLFAVGETTAAQARAAGFPTVTTAGGDVDSLARLVAARLRRQDGRLLHAAGSDLAGDLAGTLRRHGFEVGSEILYEARPASALTAPAVAALRAGTVGFALFFSPRSGVIFARLATAAGVAESCAPVAALSISAAADAQISGLKWAARRIAEYPTQAGLLAALDELLGNGRREAALGRSIGTNADDATA